MFCIEFQQGVLKACFYTKSLQGKGSKYLLLLRFKPRVKKTSYTERKNTHWLLLIGTIYFFGKSKFWKSKFTKHVCHRRNHQLLLIITHWTYFKYSDLLHTLNVYKIPRKEHQVVHFWVADKISTSELLFWKYLEYVSLILRNYKKLKSTKFLQFTIFSILN